MAIRTLDTLRRRLGTIGSAADTTAPAPVGFGRTAEPQVNTMSDPVNRQPQDNDMLATRDQDQGQTRSPDPILRLDQPQGFQEAGGTPQAPNDQDGGGVPFRDQDNGVPTRGGQPAQERDQDTAMSLAADYMRNDSAIMRRADTIGRQFGNQRGLLNSSMAGEAAMSAALDRVIPLAQQDAAAAQTRRLSRQEFQQASSLSEQQFGQQFGMSREEYRQQLGLQGNQFAQELRVMQEEFNNASALSDQEFLQAKGISRQEFQQRLEVQKSSFQQTQELSRQDNVYALQQARQQFGFAEQLSAQDAQQRLTQIQFEFENQGLLSRQQYEQSALLSDQEFKQQTGLTRQQFKNDMALQERRIGTEIELAAMDAESRAQLLAMEREMRESLSQMEIDAEDRAAANAMITDMHEIYAERERSILSNPDLPAAERTALLRNARQTLIAQTEMVETLYGIDINWTDSVVDYAPTRNPKQPSQNPKQPYQNPTQSSGSVPSDKK